MNATRSLPAKEREARLHAGTGIGSVDERDLASVEGLDASDQFRDLSVVGGRVVFDADRGVLVP